MARQDVPPPATPAALEEARRVRTSVCKMWQAVLGKLAKELNSFGAEPVSEEFVKNLKVASDQLRLDFRLDTPQADAPPAAETSADPLSDLRIVG